MVCRELRTQTRFLRIGNFPDARVGPIRSFPARDVQDGDIFRPMIIMRTKNQLPGFRDALSFSTLLLLLPAVYPAQQVDRYLLSPLALQAGLLIDVEPQGSPADASSNLAWSTGSVSD
jgi:hypothetical protein